MDLFAQVVSYAASRMLIIHDHIRGNQDRGRWQDAFVRYELVHTLGTSPQSDVAALLAYHQTPVFDLTEGSFPIATDYMPYYLHGP